LLLIKPFFLFVEKLFVKNDHKTVEKIKVSIEKLKIERSENGASPPRRLYRK